MGEVADLHIEPHEFITNSNERVDAELGRLTVPEKRSNLDSSLIELAFVRFKSISSKPRPPIVYLAGGPGGSGIETAKGSRFPLFMALRQVADVIAFDQRGTGLSRPGLLCDESLYSFPLETPSQPNELLQIMKERVRRCAEDLKKKGIDLSAYNTVESSDDLDSLRRALGAEKLILWSVSYGTHLALATIRRHGDRIHSAIMAGVEGPDHTLKLPSNYQKHLENINRLVRNDPRTGGHVPDLIGLIKSVLARLEEPVSIRLLEPQTGKELNVAVSRFDLQLMLASELGSSRFIMALPSTLYAMSNGDFKDLARWVVSFKDMHWKAYAMPTMMDCASGASEARLRRIASETKSCILGEAVNFPFPDIGEALDRPDLGDEYRSPVHSMVRALLISGTLDGNTPVTNAEEVQAGFPRSEHVVIEGAGHSDDLLLSSPKILEVILEFLRGQPLSATWISLPPPTFREIAKS